MAALRLAGLSVCGPAGRAPLLRELDLEVADGELVTLLGTGKTTLLAGLAGLAELPAGRLEIDGEDATEWIPADRDVAVVFQDHAPYPHLSVRDNLALPLRLAGRPPAAVALRVAEVALTLALTVHLDRRPSQLTGPQRQRLAVGRVLVRPRPAAYLLDEPLPADPAARRLLRAAVRGTTTVWACADPADAAALGDRVAVLRDGTLAQVGTPAELAERPADLDIARLAPLTVLAGAAADGAVRTPLGLLPVAADRPEVLVGIRPADLTETGAGVGLTLLAGDGVDPDGTARLRHPALARAAEADPRLSAEVLARVDPAGRRTVTLRLDPTRVLLFDPATGAALRPR
jgi:multiple sugar transport system ATP-binding protein